MKTPKEFIHHCDPAHGWVAVKRDFLERLGILDEITSFSYQRGGTVYLEEDKDATTFVEAFQKQFGESPAIRSSHVERTHPIRSYDAFNKDVDPRDQAKAFKGLAVGDLVILPTGYSVGIVKIVDFDRKGNPLGQSPNHANLLRIRKKHVGCVEKA